jgi:hypothetical protein
VNKVFQCALSGRSSEKPESSQRALFKTRTTVETKKPEAILVQDLQIKANQESNSKLAGNLKLLKLVQNFKAAPVDRSLLTQFLTTQKQRFYSGEDDIIKLRSS